ncbi:pacifastin inhibitor (LCMII) domain-containing protein [Phthorimaea operculella]|nr:pacifastin inhibitor (LCMII) domain-containing protein [Phthorimaea operculella]
MLLRICFLLYIRYEFVFTYTHEKPVAQTQWQGRCQAHDRVINDCNWCVCNKKTARYSCKARVCTEVDMFGHFNDAISEHLVGMEGHGSWRSNATACQPRMHYQRDDLLCVCDDDGNWPSPVCRDLFRVLHEVVLTDHERPSALHECRPRHLYLYGCNVCLCPPEGRISADACTRNNCSDNDPILEPSSEAKDQEDINEVSEIYADCELNRKYDFGCKKCTCLKNNRLLCDNCKSDTIAEDEVAVRSRDERDHCERRKPFDVFNIDCNTCICDNKGMMYCTTRRCTAKSLKPPIELSKSLDLTLRTVDPPVDGSVCTSGTKYRKDCDVCFCTQNANQDQYLSCTKKGCRSSEKRHAVRLIQDVCVENTVYEQNCLWCRCDVVDGIKRESCLLNSVCSPESSEHGSTDLDVMHGYCEPTKVYHKDCNTCKCLSDGKTVVCSSHVCDSLDEKPLEVEVIPVRQRAAQPCPKDRLYKVECNFCFCLKNGNLLCTTARCDE